MFGRILGHISKRTLHVIGFILFATLIAFFAATRTQVGRDELKRQIVKSFNESYRGELSIERLTGNLLYTLYAENVQLKSPDGELVVSVDSIVVKPRWRELLQKSFSVQSILLDNPVINLSMGPDRVSGLSRAMEKSASDSADRRSPWVFKSATFRIVNGTVNTRRQSESEIGASTRGSAQSAGNFAAQPSRVVQKSRPPSESLDLLNTTFDYVDLEARIDWNDPNGQIDLLQLTGDLDSGRLPIRGNQTQILIQGTRLSLSDFSVSIGDSFFQLSGFANVFQKPENTTWWNVPFLFDLEESSVSFSEIKSLFPQFPLSGQGQVSALIQGPLADATISWLRLRNDRSAIELTGMAGGNPDSLSVDIAVNARQLHPQDLNEWLPQSIFRHFRMDSLKVGGKVQGYYANNQDVPYASFAGSSELSSERGSISTTFEAEGPFNEELAFAVTATSNNMDLSYWLTNGDTPTDFDGALRFVGSGIRPQHLLAELRLDLIDLSVGSTRIPAIVLEGEANSGQYSAHIVASQSRGSLEVDANGSFQKDIFEYGAFVTARNFNIGPLVAIDSLVSGLNLRASILGSGFREEELAGQLQVTVDSSTVQMGTVVGTIPPHGHQLTLRRVDTVGPRITLRGDAADIDISGDVNLTGLAKLGAAWANQVQVAIARQEEKRLYSNVEEASPRDDILNSVRWADATTVVEQRFGDRPARVRSDFRIHDLGIISSYLPALPSFYSTGTGRVEVTIDDEILAIEASFQGDTLSIGQNRVENAIIGGRFSVSRFPSLESSVSLTANIQADSIGTFGRSFVDSSMEFTFDDRQGVFKFVSGGAGRVDSIRVESHVSLLEDRNEITVQDFFVQGQSSFWKNPRTPTVSLYSDAFVVRDVIISEGGVESPDGQRFAASGTFSSQPQDVLYVQADHVVLHELSKVLFSTPHLDGQLNARLEITGGENQPIVTGVVDVDHFALDNLVLGDILMESRFISGSPNLGIELDLTPSTSISSLPVLDGDRPYSRVTNQLGLSGTLRLPGTSRQGDRDSGAIALDVSIDSADVFFLRYVFKDIENVRGYLTGQGSIAGTLSKPEFDVSLNLHGGHFDVPLFELSNDLEGEIRIDSTGIQIVQAKLTDQTDGTALGRGTIFFNDYRFFSLGLDFELDEFQIMDVSFTDELPFYGHLWASGDLTLEGPLFDASLRSSNAVVTAQSELFIPVTETASNTDDAYIVFADSADHIPNFRQLATRSSLLGRRPDAERRFLDALDMELNIFAPVGSTIHLVIDPLLGDVINASSTGRVQIQRQEGNFSVFGELEVDGGDYLFTAGEVFVRRFVIEQGGTITWNGDPVNATLNIPAEYRTRASLSGLPGYEENSLGLVPLIVSLQIGGTVESPVVVLGLAIDLSRQDVLGDNQALERQLNSPGRATEYATSVLLTNTFRLTTDSFDSDSGSQLAFNSVSQLVSSQVNRFINEALPNVDFSFGLQGENAQDLDVTYGVALRLLDERLIIRGEGVYQGSRSNTDNVQTANDALQGEFLVEVRLSPRVSVEVFFRREGDILESAGLTNTTGAGLSYQTDFSTWKNFWNKLFGWLKRDEKAPDPPVATELQNLEQDFIPTRISRESDSDH